MPSQTLAISQAAEEKNPSKQESANQEDVLRYKKRMLEWSNPVEYVNNMYGSHPDDGNNDYFKVIFAK
jgi:hypothetical protein